MVEKIYPDLAVAILAGGRSSRFGADKALVRLELGGPVLIERVARIAESLSDMSAVIGHRRYEELGLSIPVYVDDEPDRGPLGGIATALRRLDRPRTLVVACDMPCLSPMLLRWMIERRSRAGALIPRTDDGRWQTMHAIYRQSIRTEVERTLDSGNGSVRALLDRISVEAVPESALQILDPELASIFSLNSPDDLERAKACVSRRTLDTDRRNIPE